MLTNEWLRCDAAGAELPPAPTTPTAPTRSRPGDVGSRIVLRVTRHGPDACRRRFNDEDSAATAVVTASRANGTAPSFTGTTRSGQTLLGNRGSWTGTADRSAYTYAGSAATRPAHDGRRHQLDLHPAAADVGQPAPADRRPPSGPGGSASASVLSGDRRAQARRPAAAGRRQPGDGTRPRTTPGTTTLRRLSPFPVVAIGGRDLAAACWSRCCGCRARRAASVVTVTCRGRGCPFRRARRTVRRRAGLRIRGLERRLRAGTVITIIVRKGNTIGKYTRLRIRRGAPPARIDRCIRPGATPAQRLPVTGLRHPRRRLRTLSGRRWAGSEAPGRRGWAAAACWSGSRCPQPRGALPPLPRRAARDLADRTAASTTSTHRQLAASATHRYSYTWYRCTIDRRGVIVLGGPRRPRNVLRAANGRHRPLHPVAGHRHRTPTAAQPRALSERRWAQSPRPRRATTACRRSAACGCAARRISADPGMWGDRVAGDPAYTYQWQRCTSRSRHLVLEHHRAPRREVHVHRVRRRPPPPRGRGSRGPRQVPGRVAARLGPVFVPATAATKRLTPFPVLVIVGRLRGSSHPDQRVRGPGAAARAGERALQGQALPVPAACAARSASASGCGSAARSAPSGPDRCSRSG